MSITIAQIAAKALTAVSKAIPDAVHTATLARVTQGMLYNATTGVYPKIILTQTARVVFSNVSAGYGMFPAYTFGPSDEVLFIEGVTSVHDGDTITIGDKVRTVVANQDIGGAGTAFMAVAR